jgi:hypothetical protein
VPRTRIAPCNWLRGQAPSAHPAAIKKKGPARGRPQCHARSTCDHFLGSRKERAARAAAPFARWVTGLDVEGGALQTSAANLTHATAECCRAAATLGQKRCAKKRRAGDGSRPRDESSTSRRSATGGGPLRARRSAGNSSHADSMQRAAPSATSGAQICCGAQGGFSSSGVVG